MIHQTRRALWSAAAATVTALPAFAQEDSTGLQEVLVTARYREENLQTTPIVENGVMYLITARARVAAARWVRCA